MTGFVDAGFYRFAADVRNEVTGPTLTEVYKEIDKMRAEGSDGAELQGAKSYLRGIFPIQTASQNGLSATLNNVYVYGLPKDYPETFRAKVAAVTPEQVKSASAALLGSDNSMIAIVGDYAKVKDQLTAFKDITFLDTDGKTDSRAAVTPGLTTFGQSIPVPLALAGRGTCGEVADVLGDPLACRAGGRRST